MVGRHVRRIQRHGGGESTAVLMPVLGVTRARDVLFRSMRDQGNSVLSVLRLLVERNVVIDGGDYYCDRGQGNDSDETYHATTSFLTRSEELISIEPKYITLSLLTAYRHHLGELISHVASTVWTICSQITNGEEEALIKMLIPHLTKDVHQLEEKQIYLEACFPRLDTNIPPPPAAVTGEEIQLGTSITKCQQLCESGEGNKNANNKTLIQMITRLRSHVEIMVVTIWALEQSILADGDSLEPVKRIDGREGNTQGEMGKEMESTEASCHSTTAITPCSYPWWKRLSHSIETTVDLYHSMEEWRLLLPNIKRGEKDSTCEMAADVVNSHNHSAYKDKSEFQTDDNYTDQHDPSLKVVQQPGNGTVVYSARGTMAKNKDFRNKSSSARKIDTSNDSTRTGQRSLLRPLPSVYHESITGRMTLLRELQSRLEVIQLTDEECDDASTSFDPQDDCNGNMEETIGGDKDDKCVTKRGSRTSSKSTEYNKDSNRAAPLFLGASGSLLAELQNAIPQSTLDHSLESVPA